MSAIDLDLVSSLDTAVLVEIQHVLRVGKNRVQWSSIPKVRMHALLLLLLLCTLIAII